MHTMDKITRILKLNDIGNDTHRRIAIVKASRIKPNRSKYGPTPRRFLNLLNNDGVLPFSVVIVFVALFKLTEDCHF